MEWGGGARPQDRKELSKLKEQKETRVNQEKMIWNEVEELARAQILQGLVKPGKEFQFYSMFIEKPGFN